MVRRLIATMWLLFACGLILHPAARQLHADPPAAQRLPTAALISADENVIISLFEAKLLAGDQANWLERNEIKRLLAEQKLDAAFGAAGGQDRLSLGKLLKADVLVLVRLVDSVDRNARVLECIVCETNQGLRLHVESLPMPNRGATPPNDTQLESTAAALEQGALAGLRKAQEKIREVVAVSPLVSENLSLKYNDLQMAYARLIEQTLLRFPGVLVVELSEAQAISRELALTNNDERVARRNQPLFLLGKFRHTTVKENTTVALQLQLLRGEQEIAVQDTKAVASEQVSSWLQSSASQLFREVKIGAPAKVDPKEDARQLAARAAMFMQIGQYGEALMLLEASLLLAPGTDLVLRDTLVAMSRAGRHKQPEQATRRDMEDENEFYLRGLRYLEEFAKVAGPLEKYREQNGFGSLEGFHRKLLGLRRTRYDDPVLQAMNEQMIKTASATYRRIGAARSKAGFHGEMWHEDLRDLPPEYGLPLIEQRLEEVKEWPDGNSQAIHLVNNFVRMNRESPEYTALLNRMESSGAPRLRAAASVIKGWIEQQRAERLALEKSQAAAAAAAKIAKKRISEIQFAPVTIRLETPGKNPETIMPGRCLPVGKGIDVFWRRGIHVMKERGIARAVWSANSPNIHCRSLFFDGRYVWAVLDQHRHAPKLIVIDPQLEKAWEFTREHGLPFEEGAGEREIGVAPEYLSAGAVEPGRVLVAGYSGRTWLAWATFDGKTQSARVFHEAREVATDDPAQAKKTTVVFTQGTIVAPQSAGPEKAATKAFVYRHCNNSHVTAVPLVVDVASDHVSVGEAPPQSPMMGVGGDDPYFVAFDQTHEMFRLYRGSPLGTQREPVLDDPPEGWMVRLGNEIHVVGMQYSIIDLDTYKVRIGVDPVPWREGNRWARKGQPMVNVQRNNDDFRIDRVEASNHYGILITMLSNLGKTQVVQATFADAGKDAKPQSR